MYTCFQLKTWRRPDLSRYPRNNFCRLWFYKHDRILIDQYPVKGLYQWAC